MPRRARLDAELVRRGLARSREHASELVAAGRVTVRGMVATKPATAVGLDTPVVVRLDDDPGWASRGAHKLLGALEAFEPAGLAVAGRRCLDAGASTGGFTDVLLRRDAKSVVAELFDAAGFFPIDLGDLVPGGGMQQAGGPLAGHNLVRMPAPWE